ncbi:MAG TPA: hypothetical protein PLM75_01645 [bacterium]|nr:hypothetical protein [bacterium]HPP86549.1 hypothetical protein [bacterium]
MKISSETIYAIETQIETYKSRIDTYNVTIERLQKMPTTPAVIKSIEGYKTQVQFLNSKIEILKQDLEYLKTLTE